MKPTDIAAAVRFVRDGGPWTSELLDALSIAIAQKFVCVPSRDGVPFALTAKGHALLRHYRDRKDLQ